MINKKVVLVTGASRGIGKETALEYARHDYAVVIVCKENKDKLDEVKKAIEALDAPCLSYTCDLASYDECQMLFNIIQDSFGRLDILINNAGISYVGLLQDMSNNDWENVLNSNLTSMHNCTKLALPMMLKAGSGKIINMSSVWGCVGGSCEVAYSATKGAIDSYTKALAKELAPSNIQVLAIAPGAIDTDMNNNLTADEKEALAESIPMGRLGRASEVASLSYILSTCPSYMTGQVIRIDGGWI